MTKNFINIIKFLKNSFFIMNSLDLSSFLRESITEFNHSSFMSENNKIKEKYFSDDLSLIEKISIKEEILPKFDAFLLKVKRNNILESIDEEDDKFGNSLTNQKTLKTVELAHTFLNNLALPLDDFQENRAELSSLLNSNKVSFRSSKYNRLSNVTKINNKTINYNDERLSRLSVMACELENSQYFNFNRKEITMSKNNDFIDSPLGNLFDLNVIIQFKMMRFSDIFAQLKFSKNHYQIQNLIVNVCFNILNYIQTEDILFEKLIAEIEFIKKKLINYLELIKSNDLYLNENLDLHTNYQQVLFKKSLWILALKKMASNLANLYSIVSRINSMKSHSEFYMNKTIKLNNFWTLIDDYKTLRQIYYDKALDTIENVYKVTYNGKSNNDKVREEVQANIYKNDQNLFITKKLEDSFLELIKFIDNLRDLRKNIIPLFFEELDNTVILIEAYCKKYRKKFNIFQNYTTLISEIFHFRNIEIKTLKLKTDNFQEKAVITYRDLTQNTAKAQMMKNHKANLLLFKKVKEKSYAIFSKIKKSQYTRFPSIQYEYLVGDLEKIKGILYFNKSLFKTYDEVFEKITFYNNLIKNTKNIKVLLNNPISLQDSFRKYIFFFQEFKNLESWLKTFEKCIKFKEFSLQIKNSLDMLKINIECLTKMKKNLDLNENYEKIISNEEHQSNLLVAQLHKIKKMEAINETSLEIFQNLLENLEIKINKFKFYNDLQFLEKDLKLRIQKIQEFLEKNKNLLEQIIRKKKDKEWHEFFEIKINNIRNFMINLNEAIEANEITDYSNPFLKCQEFIEYLNLLILEEFKKEDVMEICKVVLSELNLIFQLLKEKFLLQNIIDILNVESLKDELISLLSEKNNIDDYITKNNKISNGLKNKRNQIMNEEFVFLNSKYEEILEFIQIFLIFLEGLEKEFEKIQNKTDTLEDSLKNIEKETNQLIENFKREDNLIPRAFFTEQFIIFLKNFQMYFTK